MSLVKNNGNFPSLLHEVFGRDMDHMFDGPFTNWLATQKGTVMPGINIREDNVNFCIEVAAPGMKKEDFKITLENSMLTISAEQQELHEEKNPESRYTRREFNYQSFSRSFQLPDTCEQEKIEARYKNGILYLTVPKKEEARRKSPRLIEIS
jgi:HSP20 family protein